MHKGEAEDAPNMVIGTFSIQAQPIDVLFDSGAMHSFISVKLVKTLGLLLTCKSPLLFVILPDGKNVKCDELYEACLIWMCEHEFLADLYKFELTDFEDGLVSEAPSSNRHSKTKNRLKGA